MTGKKPVSDKLRRQIEVRAYLIWESEGKPEGRREEHWARAEAELLRAAKPKKPSRAKLAPKTNGKPAAAKAVVAVKAKKPAKAGQPATH